MEWIKGKINRQIWFYTIGTTMLFLCSVLAIFLFFVLDMSKKHAFKFSYDPLYINPGALQHVFVATCYHENDS